ncbi:MAG: ferritin family protein [Thermodesulfobacteriota bacterium]|nr:ferritin family protein [Thermodesulfobacteriota bacterium]
MPAKTEERIQALEVALNNELRERDFYLKNKERTKNPHGQAMFASIASDEDEHYHRILELHKRLQKDGKWPETVPLQVKGTEVKAIIRKLTDSVDTSSKADMDDLEAVKMAIDFESKGEKYYGDLAQSAADPVEKNFYELLSSIEREHRLSLQDTFEYFQDPAGWYRIKEKHHIDGA